MPASPPVPACVRCGRDAQFDVAELWLCLDCYHVAGSTCAGITRPRQAGPPGGTDEGDGPGSVC